MTTIKEIAKLANVSAATVSNVLNGKGGASEAKKKQIRELAAQLHYTPNTLAKSLKRRRSKTIGIITEDLTVFNTPEIVDGIDACCESSGFDIIIGNMRLFKKYNNDFTDTERHQQLLDKVAASLMARQVEGMIYIGYHCREIAYLPNRAAAVPLVYAYCFPCDRSIPSVIYDDEKAAYDMTNLLIQNGHTKIGALCGPFDSFHTQTRLRGFQTCLFDHGILYDSRLTLFGDWGRESGRQLGGQLIQSGVRAIFSMSDEMASGVYDYCADHHLTVGKDIALTGFDNREISLAYRPPLTTVALPLYDIGAKSARILLDEINGTKAPDRHYEIPCRIVERGSVCNLQTAEP